MLVIPSKNMPLVDTTFKIVIISGSSPIPMDPNITI